MKPADQITDHDIVMIPGNNDLGARTLLSPTYSEYNCAYDIIHYVCEGMS